MRPVLVTWVAAHHVPGWLVPDYFSLVGLSGILVAALALSLALRDGADLAREARALSLAYAAALIGGYLIEVLRQVPAALLSGSAAPLLQAGRAAYGGLLGAAVAAALYLRHQRLPLGPFFDRVSIGVGLSVSLVRLGCFLAGCDYGTPAPWGLRFPPGSPAAVDHARRGLVAGGAASLPVHPTQLYESALGLAAAAVAALLLRRGRRDGRAFLGGVAVYAAGRLAIEGLRGDAGRGLYGGLSTAQYLSLGLLVAAALLWRSLARPGAGAVAAATVECSVSGRAWYDRKAT